MYYIDTDVLIHSLIKQNPILHLQVKNLLDQLVTADKLKISWLSIQETAFVRIQPHTTLNIHFVK